MDEKTQRNIILILFFFILAFLTSCTINMIQTDTHGVATDVVDSDPKTDAQVNPNITIPLKTL